MGQKWVAGDGDASEKAKNKRERGGRRKSKQSKVYILHEDLLHL